MGIRSTGSGGATPRADRRVGGVLRRLRPFAAVLLLGVLACAPSATPAPTTAPTAAPKPAATTAPAAAPSTAPAPAAAASPAASPVVAASPAAAASPIAAASPVAAPKPGAAAPSGPLTKVNARVGFTWASGQYYSMFLLGKDKGFFANHGLDVTFGEGQGSASTSQVIANGQADIAVAVDPGSMIRTDVGGANLIMVGQNVPNLPIGVLSKASAPIKTPQDLIGKKIGLPPGTTQSQLFPAFLKLNNIDPSQLTIINTPANVIQQSLASGQIDGFASFAHSQVPILKSMGVEPYAMLLSDFGLKYSPGEGIIVKKDFLEAHPDVVKGFAAGIEDSLEYGIDHPDEAGAAGAKAFPEAMQADVATAQNQIVADIIKKNRIAGKPIIYIDPNAFANLIPLLTQYAELSGAAAPNTYFSDDYVPQ